MSGGSLVAPRVPAGKYTVRITKGSEVFEKEFDVIYDRNSPFTAAERNEQQRVTNELFNFTQDLAYLVYQIDTWDSALEEYIKAIPKLGNHFAAAAKGLDNSREQCVVTTGDNYVGAAEPRLREKLGDIYSNIASYYGAPSPSQMETIQVLREQFKAQQVAYAALQSGD